MSSLELYLTFSDATKSGPRPIVIFGHGLGGDKDSVWGTAERLAELGVAVVGIDAPEHGSRSDPPTKDGKSDLFGAVTGFFAANPDTKQFDMERVRELHVRALVLVREHLPDVVEECAALGHRDVETELRRHDPREERDLLGVGENVLPVARAPLHAADELDELGVQSRDSCLVRSLFTGLDDPGVHLAPRFVDDFLDATRVNPNGGAIALGHPVGATGAIITIKALYELERIRGRRALVTMCIGGGQGIALAIERLAA